VKLRRYTYKLTIFYLREQINLSAAQIKLCLDAKHWDPNVWTIARCIAFICAKLLPNCIPGTLTPQILMPIFAFDSERIYINLTSAAIVNDNAVPGPPRRSLCRWSSPSLLSRCFLHRHCHCLHRPTAAASAINVVAISPAAATYLLPWS
jgi:hypothetical protein